MSSDLGQKCNEERAQVKEGMVIMLEGSAEIFFGFIY